MNKTTILFLFILSLSLFSFIDGNKKKNDLEKDNIHGRVKSIHVYEYNRAGQQNMEIDPLKISLNDTNKHSIINYDRNGNLVESINSNGIKTESCSYDSSMKKIHSFTFNIKDNTKQEGFYSYDNKGMLIEIRSITIKKDTPELKTLYKYDAKNMLVETDWYTKNKYTYKWLYKYDESRKEIENIKINASDSLLEKWVYEYNGMGNKTELALYNDSLIERFVYTYNENGDVTEEILYGRFNRMFHDYKYKFEYDNKSNWVRRVYYEGATQKSNIVRVYEYY